MDKERWLATTAASSNLCMTHAACLEMTQMQTTTPGKRSHETGCISKAEPPEVEAYMAYMIVSSTALCAGR